MYQPYTLECLNSLIGIPYSEVDCWELVKKFYVNIFDIDLSSHNETYDNSLNPKETSRYMDIHKLSFDKVADPSLGDIMLLKVKGLNAHLGIYLGRGKMLHTMERTGSVIDKISRWETKIEGYYRWQY